MGLGLGPGQVPQALERVKKRRFINRNRARDVFLEAMVDKCDRNKGLGMKLDGAKRGIYRVEKCTCLARNDAHTITYI